MPDAGKITPSTATNSYQYLLKQVIAAAITSAAVYFLIRPVMMASFPQFGSTFVQVFRLTLTFLVAAPALFVSARNFRALRKADIARDANVQVAEELNKLKGRTPVSEISTKAVTDSLKDIKVSADQLARIVEQHKQQLLIDDEYFREELRILIVEFLQPLPRNAKRLVNRFRVNLLIANSRHLLTSEPKVTAQQIGKWLVMLERWPQLGRSLSVLPAKMTLLEEQSVASPEQPMIIQEPPSEPTPAQPKTGKEPVPQSAPAPQDAAPDAFMQTVKGLAEPYFGDEDLRKFIRSQPQLATVLARLVHYGSPESLS